jgi:aspartate/methionine/tyrosine aminotransferase
MRIEREKLGDWFILGSQSGYRYSLTGVGRPPLQLADLGAIDPDISLDWGGNYFGPPLLKERIIAAQEYKLQPDNLFLTNGTYEANYVAVMGLVAAGDEVIVETPAWTQVGMLCRALGANVKTLRLREEDGWLPDPDELAALMTPKTRMVYLNHPNNPTGSCLTAEHMAELARVIGRHGAHLLSDEIYRGLEWDGAPISASAANFYERAIVTNSLTKSMGLCGLRLGWVATPDREAYERTFAVHRYAVMVTSHLSELLATRALEPSTYRRLLQAGKDVGQQNLDAIRRWMDGNQIFRWVEPQAGFISFARFNLDLSSWDLCRTLLDEPYKTYMVPGICYGEEFDTYVRIGFGGKGAEKVPDGLEQLETFCRERAPAVPGLRRGARRAEIVGSLSKASSADPT